MKWTKKAISILLGATIICGTVSAEPLKNEINGKTKVKEQKEQNREVEISKNEINLKPKEKFILKAKIGKYFGSNRNVKWSTNNVRVAKVTLNGKVTATGEGVAYITATDRYSNSKAVCRVVVKDNNTIVEDVFVNTYNQISLKIGESDISNDEIFRDIKKVVLQINDKDVKVQEFINLMDENRTIILKIKMDEPLIGMGYLEKSLKMGDSIKVIFRPKSGSKIKNFRYIKINKAKLDGLRERQLKPNESFKGEIYKNEIVFFNPEEYFDISEYEKVQFIRANFKLSQGDINSIELRVNDDNILLMAPNGEYMAYGVKKMPLKLEFEGYTEKLEKGETYRINIRNSEKIKLEVVNEFQDIVKTELLDGELIVTTLKQGEASIILRGEAIRSDGSIVEGMKMQKELGFVIEGNLEFNIQGIKVLKYNTIQFKSDIELDYANDLVRALNLKINGEETEISKAFVEDGKLILEFENPYTRGYKSGEVEHQLNSESEIDLKYTALDGTALTFKGDIVENFEKKVRVEKTLKNIQGEEIEIEDDSFFGEVIEEEKKISLFELMDIEDVMNALKGNENIELIYAGGSFFGSKYAALIAPDGSNRLYKIKNEPFDFAFQSENHQIINVGDKELLSIYNDRNFDYELSISEEGILEIEKEIEGLKIKAIKTGSVDLAISSKVTRYDGSVVQGKVLKSSKTITVMAVPVSSISLSEKKSIEVGEHFELQGVIKPVNATNKNITWSSLNPEVVNVDSTGVITGVKIGEAKIVARADNGVEAICNVSVTPESISAILNEKTGRVEILIQGVKEKENGLILKIQNKKSGDIELIQEYELGENDYTISFKLDKGQYYGEINIFESRRFIISLFNVK